MKTYSKNRKLIKVIFFVLLLILIITTVLVYPEKKVDKINYLVSKCSFKPTNDSPSNMDLPIIVINTNEKIDSYSENEIKANFKLYDSCDLNSSTVDKEILINVRGRSSRLDPKKQYTIDFDVNDNNTNSISILGMPENTKWTLNGAYKDKSSIRNYLAYNLGSKFMEYSPRTRFVEVYLNESNEELSYEKHYIGLYLLVEKIERDINRVNIKKFDEKYNDISFIISRDKADSKDTIFRTNWGELQEDYIIGDNNIIKENSVLKSVYPSSKSITNEYEKKILDYINGFEDSLYGVDFKNSNEGYRNYIDIYSFIDLAIINEIFKNIDGGEVSTYFYKDIGGKMKAGPLWDFDQTLGNTIVQEVNESTGFRIVNTIWFNRLFQDPYFVEEYKMRYKYLRGNALSKSSITKTIDEAVLYIDNAVMRNNQLWYSDFEEFNYESEINSSKTFILDRLEWIDNNLNNIKRYEDSLE